MVLGAGADPSAGYGHGTGPLQGTAGLRERQRRGRSTCMVMVVMVEVMRVTMRVLRSGLWGAMLLHLRGLHAP